MRFIIAASLTSKLKTSSEPSTMTGEPSTMEVDGGAKVRVGCGGEVEVNGS